MIQSKILIAVAGNYPFLSLIQIMSVIIDLVADLCRNLTCVCVCVPAPAYMFEI